MLSPEPGVYADVKNRPSKVKELDKPAWKQKEMRLGHFGAEKPSDEDAMRKAHGQHGRYALRIAEESI